MPPVPEPGMLSGVALFRGLPSEELSRLAAVIKERSFPAGTHVITAEEPGEVVYITLQGSARCAWSNRMARRSSPPFWAPGRWWAR